MIEKHHLEIGFEFGRYEPPHVLITAKSMSEIIARSPLPRTWTLFLQYYIHVIFSDWKVRRRLRAYAVQQTKAPTQGCL